MEKWGKIDKHKLKDVGKEIWKIHKIEKRKENDIKKNKENGAQNNGSKRESEREKGTKLES